MRPWAHDLKVLNPLQIPMLVDTYCYLRHLLFGHELSVIQPYDLFWWNSIYKIGWHRRSINSPYRLIRKAFLPLHAQKCQNTNQPVRNWQLVDLRWKLSYLERLSLLRWAQDICSHQDGQGQSGPIRHVLMTMHCGKTTPDRVKQWIQHLTAPNLISPTIKSSYFSEIMSQQWPLW